MPICTCQPGVPGLSVICVRGETCRCTYHRCEGRSDQLAPAVVSFANEAFNRLAQIPDASGLETDPTRVMDRDAVSAVIILRGGQRVEVTFRQAGNGLPTESRKAS